MTLDYLTYLESQHWAALRRATINKANRKCEACKRGGVLHGHHLCYRNPLTDCTTEDIMALCVGCHDRWHDWLRKTGKSLLMFDRVSTILMLSRIGAKRERPKKPSKSQKKKIRKRMRKINAPKIVKQRIERQFFGSCGTKLDGIYRI